MLQVKIIYIIHYLHHLDKIRKSSVLLHYVGKTKKKARMIRKYHNHKLQTNPGAANLINLGKFDAIVSFK